MAKKAKEIKASSALTAPQESKKDLEQRVSLLERRVSSLKAGMEELLEILEKAM